MGRENVFPCMVSTGFHFSVTRFTFRFRNSSVFDEVFADFQGQVSSSIVYVEPTGTRRPTLPIITSTRFPDVIYVGQFLKCNPRIEPKVPWNNGTLNFVAKPSQIPPYYLLLTSLFFQHFSLNSRPAKLKKSAKLKEIFLNSSKILS